eukprot:6157437-Pleurochrysis_carterae.AAC.1
MHTTPRLNGFKGLQTTRAVKLHRFRMMAAARRCRRSNTRPLLLNPDGTGAREKVVGIERVQADEPSHASPLSPCERQPAPHAVSLRTDPAAAQRVAHRPRMAPTRGPPRQRLRRRRRSRAQAPPRPPSAPRSPSLRSAETACNGAPPAGAGSDCEASTTGSGSSQASGTSLPLRQSSLTMFQLRRLRAVYSSLLHCRSRLGVSVERGDDDARVLSEQRVEARLCLCTPRAAAPTARRHRAEVDVRCTCGAITHATNACMALLEKA